MKRYVNTLHVVGDSSEVKRPVKNRHDDPDWELESKVIAIAAMTQQGPLIIMVYHWVQEVESGERSAKEMS